MRGYTTGDNWTPEAVNAVATVLSELKDRYHPRRAILVGHSGGAANSWQFIGSAQDSGGRRPIGVVPA
jgi:pimeloyl-ACP methyl ester carboxylesterase